jgi:hypothetical protein
VLLEDEAKTWRLMGNVILPANGESVDRSPAAGGRAEPPTFATDFQPEGGNIMEALKLLVGSDIGLISLFTIGLVIVMGFYLVRLHQENAEEDARKAQ